MASQKNDDGTVTNWATYNWMMDPEASRDMMALQGVPMTLYSSHMIGSSLGGSVNPTTYERIIAKFEAMAATHEILRDSQTAGLSWDNHLMELIPRLREIIGPNAGRQFTPADPAIIIGIVHPEFLLESRQSTVKIYTTQVDMAQGIFTVVEDDEASQIRVIEKVDKDLFQSVVLECLDRLAQP